jgi:HlyD family secretion protein
MMTLPDADCDANDAAEYAANRLGSTANDPTQLNGTLAAAFPTDASLLRAVGSDEFLPPTRRWITWSGLLLASAVVAATALASVTQYNVTIRANATVRPTGELRLVQAQMEGAVQQILAQENQAVRQGDVIATLDATQLYTRQRQLEGSIRHDRGQIAQLDSQIRALNQQMAAESSVTQRVLAVGAAELSRNQREYQDRTLTTTADVREAESALELAQDQRDRYAQLATAGAISQMQLQEKESAVKSAAARLEKARALLQPSPAGITIAQQQMAQQQAKGVSTLAVLQKDREALVQQQVQVQAQLSKNEQDLQQTERDLQRRVIRATSAGVVLQLNLRNSGQVVRPGDAIAQIAPADSRLVVKATVATQDIEKVTVGQRVQLRVAACPYPDYGTLGGVVQTVSPDAIAPQRPTGTPNSLADPETTRSFEVTIQPDALALGTGPQKCQMQAGMEAKADIISKSETVLQFLLRKARLLTDV